MNLNDDYDVLFLGGGASLQFAMVPFNLMKENGKAAYLDSGNWAATSMKEAIKTTNVITTVEILLKVVFRHHSNKPVIQCVKLSNCFSNQRMNFSKAFLPVRCCNFPNLDDNQGIMVKEANNDNNVAITTYKYAMKVAYKGSNYSGSQIQPGQRV
jgi:hypothetical protein